MKLTVDGVTDAITGSDQAVSYEHVALLIGLLAAVGLAVVLVRSLQTLVSEALAQVVTDHVTDLIHAQSVAVDLEYYESPRYHDALFRAQREAPHRPSTMVHNLTATGHALVSLVAMAGLLLTLHWAVGLVVIFATVPAAVVRFYYRQRPCQGDQAL
jgi:ATP-binding cassette subfamily B protein